MVNLRRVIGGLAITSALSILACTADEVTAVSSSTGTGDTEGSTAESTPDLEIPPDGYCVHSDELDLLGQVGSFTDEDLHRLTGCRVVRGEITISFYSTLDPLVALEEIDSLEVRESLALEPNLQGLGRLHTVHNRLGLSDSQLSEIDELVSLREVGELSLGRLSGLQRLSLPPHAHIRSLYLDELPSFEQFDVDASVDVDSVFIAGSPKLHVDASLQNLLRSASRIYLDGVTLPVNFLGEVQHLEVLELTRTNMHDLRAFSGLRSLGSLTLESNDDIVSLTGLENLRGEIAANLWISGNSVLTDISALANIESAGSVRFSDTPAGLLGQLTALRTAGALGVVAASGERLVWPPLSEVEILLLRTSTVGDLGVPPEGALVGTLEITDNRGFTDDEARAWATALQIAGEINIAHNSNE